MKGMIKQKRKTIFISLKVPGENEMEKLSVGENERVLRIELISPVFCYC